jgi:dTDP-4-amino-4,6-dideoxygalactose transaminase
LGDGPWAVGTHWTPAGKGLYCRDGAGKAPPMCPIPREGSDRMRSEFLPFSPPFIGQEEIDEVVDTLRSSWITTGPKTKVFEKEFASYVGAPAALALSSCTAALHTALVVAGIGPGDEVITTTFTFVATVSVIEHVGARPVLVDVEPDTLNIDPARVAEAVTQRTKAVIAVHYGGHPCDLDALHAVCSEHDLLLIEDAAHAIPARYKGRMIGASPNPVAFSFYATKNLTTAEGGMLTWTPEMIECAGVASLHGMNRDAWKRNDKTGSWRYDIVTPGFKYNMTDIQAAMGLQQLKKMDAILAKRRELVALYRELLEPLEVFDLPVEREDCESAWHLFPVRIREGVLKISRDEFIEGMRARNIGTSVHFIPVHTFTYYREKYGFADEDFPVAFRESERLVSLPLHPGLSRQDVRDVVEAVNGVVRS